MALDKFFANHPVFALTELDSFLARRNSVKRSTRNSLLSYYRRQGRLLTVRRGVYAAVPVGTSPESALVNPYLIAAKMTADAVLGYHTALEFYGRAYSMHREFVYLTQRSKKQLEFRSHVFRGVKQPWQLVRKHKEQFGVKEESVLPDSGLTPLHVAALSGHSAVVKLLVKAGADIDALTDQGRTPLHLAASRGHADVVRLLMKLGAKINMRDSQGRLPLHYATGAKPGFSVRVTGLERTLVDVMDRPSLSGTWEEIWRSLESVEFFDLEIVIEYALLLENATTAAKVGFFLEQHREALMVDGAHLKALRDLRPRQPHYLDRGKRREGRLVPGWNLVVPREILERSWAKVL